MDTPNAKEKVLYTNIVLLRGIASALVVYDHIWAISPRKIFEEEFVFAQKIREFVTGPTGIIQDFGWFGVVLFFLISGFLITHVSFTETRRGFAIRRIFRIFPALIVAVLFAGFTGWLARGVSYRLQDYLFAFSLLNYMIAPQVVILGAAWTLVIEMLFYILIFILFPVLKWKPSLAVFIEFIVLAVIAFLSKKLGPSFHLFSVSASYINYLLIGQLIYLLHAGKISVRYFSILLVVGFWFIFSDVLRVYPAFFAVDNSYIISFLYAFFVFCIALLLRPHIVPSKFFTFLSNISYSLYLFHGSIGPFILKQIAKLGSGQMMIATGIVLATFVSYLLAYLVYRYVEIPSIQLGKVLANKLEGKE